MIVAIDGPAASGKSSTAQLVAQRLGYVHLDSGAIYRAATTAALATEAPPEGWTEDFVLAQTPRVSIAPAGHRMHVIIDGKPSDIAIRDVAVTAAVSAVAQMPRIRGWVNEILREFARDSNVVADGRDIGTAVFPHAELKIFLVADPWERARRRLLQSLGRSPTDAEIGEETQRLVKRDAADALQTMQARDAVLVDTTFVTQDEQVARIVALAHSVAGNSQQPRR